MKTAILAAITAAFALSVAAQEATMHVEPRTPAVEAPASTKPTTPRETARIAKAQNRDIRCATKEKQPRRKKASAT